MPPTILYANPQSKVMLGVPARKWKIDSRLGRILWPVGITSMRTNLVPTAWHFDRFLFLTTDRGVNSMHANVERTCLAWMELVHLLQQYWIGVGVVSSVIIRTFREAFTTVRRPQVIVSSRFVGRIPTTIIGQVAFLTPHNFSNRPSTVFLKFISCLHKR